LQEVFGIQNDDIFKAASGFGGGVGMMSDVCGAIVGAGMMLSLQCGREREDIENLDALRESGIPVAKLYKWFQTEFGSATCHDIRTRFGGGAFYDFFVPWQRELADQARVFEQCSELVGKAAAKAAGMLWDAIESEKNSNTSGTANHQQIGGSE
jgi:C_GCAxxG_C_C family probable redox protein